MIKNNGIAWPMMPMITIVLMFSIFKLLLIIVRYLGRMIWWLRIMVLLVRWCRWLLCCSCFLFLLIWIDKYKFRTIAGEKHKNGLNKLISALLPQCQIWHAPYRCGITEKNVELIPDGYYRKPQIPPQILQYRRLNFQISANLLSDRAVSIARYNTS